MLRKIALIIAGLVFVGGLIYLGYLVFFGIGSDEYKDVTISYVDGSFGDKEKVEAECSISEENKFCFRDDNWAKKQNAIEYEGYANVEFTNNSDVIMEVSLATVKLENLTIGDFTLRSQSPTKIFLDPQGSTKVFFDFSFDAEDETEEQIKQDGIKLKVTFISIVGTKASEEFVVEYQ